MKTIIVGSKKYKFNKLNTIVDKFENNYRFNMSLPGSNNGTKYDKIILNNHVFDSLFQNITQNINKYNGTFSISNAHIINFYNNIKKYKNVIKQKYQDIHDLNIFLNKINCNCKFTHLPRIGYQCVIDNVINNNKPYILGFSLVPFNFEEHIYNKNLKYGNPSLNQIQRSGHNEETEIKVLLWLHDNDYIDATLCMISNECEKYILLDCSIINPKIETLILILKTYNVCYLQNYKKEELLLIISIDNNIKLDINENKLFYIN